MHRGIAGRRRNADDDQPDDEDQGERDRPSPGLMHGVRRPDEVAQETCSETTNQQLSGRYSGRFT